ncbi:hypothetical protein SLS58_002199 [Diplodia intermedia]|uniref:Uncharacterized protein n=1 Tax=Diplodia intermedia TaxID=856260 RepID=A0ABR3U0U0_9PEZI
MSFGFGVGDFIAAGELCRKLYRNVYTVSIEAPEEITCLQNELSQLKSTIDMLVQEVKDPNSLIARCGQDRVKHANGIMSEVKTTLLEKLEKLVGKYEYFISQVGGAKKNIMKRKWDKVKYASEIRTINDLRVKAITGELERQESLHVRPDLRIIQRCDLRIWTTVETMSLEPVLGQATQDDSLPCKTAEGDGFLMVSMSLCLSNQNASGLVHYVPSHTSRESLLECTIFVEINVN